MQTQKENGYFTIEAAMVLTLVIGVIVLLIYLVVFQYNRCLMEQDVGALALKGCSMQAADKDELMQILMQSADSIYQEKYLMWQGDSPEMKLAGESIEVTQRGSLSFPFTWMYEGEIDGFWTATANYENHRIDPVGTIRLYRKLAGGE